LLGVRRRVRRRKHGLRGRIKRYLKKSGIDKKVFIAAAGFVAIVLAFFLYDLLFAVFPLKSK
jgi:hypothetical protein